MKTHQTINGAGAQDAGHPDIAKEFSPRSPAAAAIRRKRLRCLGWPRRSSAFGALAVGVALVAPALHAQISSPNSFTDDNWNSLGAMESWTDGTVYATAIADRAFRRCGDLDSIMFPGTVSDIGNDTFDSCYNLTTVTLPDSVASIGAGAFSKCFNLEYVTLGDGVTFIGDRAFESCTGLTNLTIPNSVTWIGDSVCATCTSLTSVSIGSGFNDIGAFAFAHCGEAAQAETGRD